jgi:uncharacterized protein (DUF488 family)
MPDKIIFSIGHSNLPLVNFCIKLVNYKINTLVDVRTKPYSRWNPQFNRKSLEHHLNLLEISYVWKGQNLGGLDINIDFGKSVKWLAGQSKTKKVVILCSEKDYRKCHRHLLIEPELLKYDVKVKHI